MQSIEEILPSALALMTNDKITLIKSKAVEYADTYIRGGDAPALYMRDYNSGMYTRADLNAVAELTDVYIAVKEGLYTRQTGAARQNELLKKYYPQGQPNKT